MNEGHLPNDLAHWPDDPNELLGVSFGVTPRELRRAYNRLIRVYKPEQFPEQFRRIREAYEYLLRIAEMFAPPAETADLSPVEELQILPVPKEQPPGDGAVEWIAGSPRPIEETDDEEAVPTRARPEEELDELWESAIADRPAVAYERLMQRTQQHAGRTEFYLRLYWLRTLFPELDARRVPADWLVQGLLATGLAGPLRELYREEVADDPAEALSERYERLLDAPISTSQLADLMEWRFQAAVRLRRWEALADDVRRLRRRFGPGEDQLWLRLRFALADRLAWTEDDEARDLFENCRAEINHYEHLASNMSHLFDRFDLLLGASAGWHDLRRLGRASAIMIQLIGSSWSRPFAEVREPLMDVLESMAGSPQQWLDHLDEMHKRVPLTLALFGELLDQFEEVHPGGAERGSRGTPTGLALAFLLQLSVVNYEAERIRLLLFCIREAIAPEEMAEAAGGTWEQALTADWPLRYICRACRLFWA